MRANGVEKLLVRVFMCVLTHILCLEMEIRKNIFLFFSAVKKGVPFGGEFFGSLNLWAVFFEGWEIFVGVF